MNDFKKDFQRLFEFVVKNKGNTLQATNSEIKKFLNWAIYYRKLFVVWAPAGTGNSQRIAALGIAWRTEKVSPQQGELTFENTEFGDKLYVFQVIVHPDFRSSGTLFQLLSLALWRYPGVETVFWDSHHHNTGRTVAVPLQRLLRMLSKQIAFKRLKKFIRRKVWVEAADHQHQKFPNLEYLQ